MEHRFRRKWFENTTFCIAVVKLACTANKSALCRPRYIMIEKLTFPLRQMTPAPCHRGAVRAPPHLIA